MKNLYHSPNQIDSHRRVIEAILAEIDSLIDQYPFLREEEHVMTEYNALVVQTVQEDPDPGETSNIYDTLMSSLEHIENKFRGVCDFQNQFGGQRKLFAFAIPDFLPSQFEYLDTREMPDLGRDGLRETHLKTLAGTMIMGEQRDGFCPIARGYREEVRKKLFDILACIAVKSHEFNKDIMLDLDATLHTGDLGAVMEMTDAEIEKLQGETERDNFWNAAGRLIALTRKYIADGKVLKVARDEAKRKLICEEFFEKTGQAGVGIFETGHDELFDPHDRDGVQSAWINPGAASLSRYADSGSRDEGNGMDSFLRMKMPKGWN